MCFFKYLYSLIITFFLIGYESTLSAERATGQSNVVLSISSDGKYAISSDFQRRIILWDLVHHNSELISRNGNIYSASWVKHTNNFMWQDLNNIVHVQNVSGKTIKKFENFPVYGHVMFKDPNNYFASKDNWNLYQFYGNKQRIISHQFMSFYGSGKLKNLTLSTDGSILLTAGDAGDKYGDISLDQRNGKINLDGVVLWNAKTGKPLKKLTGNVFKTVASISPDNRYIISGDENAHAYIWQIGLENKKYDFKRTPLWDIYFGERRCADKEIDHCKFMNNTGITPPKDFVAYDETRLDPIFSIKFIDRTHFLRFTTDIPYAILYTVNDPKPLKYFPLLKKPRLILSSYDLDESLDTAPQAHTLVMSTTNGGVIEYKYDPKLQTLKQVWIGKNQFQHIRLVQWFLDLV